MGDKPLPAVPPRILNLKTPPFPPAYADPLAPNDKLKQALFKAIDNGPGRGWRTGVAIASLEKKGAHPMAHFKGDREFFGASMIKVAALYALFELRNTLRAIAKELATNTSKTELLKDASLHLNPKILNNLTNLPALKGVSKEMALPQYGEAFTVVDAAAAGEFTVEFSKAFKPDRAAPANPPIGHIEKMITVSNNTSAARCIHACGYGYLNGALASAGLFEPKNGPARAHAG